MLLSDLNVVHNVVTADRLHVSVLHELLTSDMLKVPVPFQLCIFTHPVVYFSGSILARRSLSIVFEFGSGSVCHRSGLVRFAERYGFLFSLGSVRFPSLLWGDMQERICE